MADVKTIAIVGGAVALPALLEMGKHAGAANTAAASSLTGTTIAGFTFAAGGKLVEAWAAMNRALAGKQLANGELHQVCDAWMRAFADGAAADPINYALIVESLDFGELTGGRGTFADPSEACLDQYAAWRSELGRAVCALIRTRDLTNVRWADVDQADVMAQTRALAVAMDNADYRREGDRRSDRAPAGLADVPGFIADKAIGAITGMVARPALAIAVGVGAFLAWRYIK